MSKPNYDTTVARIAGNIASGLFAARGAATSLSKRARTEVIEDAVFLAWQLVEEVRVRVPPADGVNVR